MTPSEQCKQEGFNLKKLSQYSGISERTLINWHTSRPEAFKLLIAGYKAKLNK